MKTILAFLLIPVCVLNIENMILFCNKVKCVWNVVNYSTENINWTYTQTWSDIGLLEHVI